MALIQTINVSTPNDGLGDSLRASQVKANENFAELNAKKVEVIPGQGLTDNNFSDDDKAKLDGIEAGAEVNVQSNWNQDDPGEPDYILNKPTIAGEILIMDGIIGVTAGFVVGQVSFTLPTAGAVCRDVYVNSVEYDKTTPNNASRVSRWSQTGDVVTITKATVLNNYVKIKYY